MNASNDNKPRLDDSGPMENREYYPVSVASAQMFVEIMRYVQSQSSDITDCLDALANVLVALVTNTAKSEEDAIAYFDASRTDIINAIRHNWPAVAQARAARN